MDQQADALVREASAQTADPLATPGLMQVDVRKLPPGAQGYSMVSTLSGNRVCTRSIQYRSLGDGRPPEVVTRTSGACADEKRPSPSAMPVSSADTSRPGHAERQPV